MWQYGLLMQIPDWLGWRHLRINPNQKMPNSYGISAMILNYYTTIDNIININCNK